MPVFANFNMTSPVSCSRKVMAVPVSSRSHRGRNGFTALELVMVMLVIGILLGLTVPIASSLQGRFKAGSARDVFINTYARARAAAIQFGREGRLHMKATEGRFWVEVDTGVAGAVATDTLGVVVDVKRDYGGVTMFTPRQVLCFDSRGLAYSGGACEPHDAIIVFARMDRADTVQLSLGGTVVRRQ